MVDTAELCRLAVAVIETGRPEDENDLIDAMGQLGYNALTSSAYVVARTILAVHGVQGTLLD